MHLSIITVCYNAEKSIRQTLKSVLYQNFLDYEYIIQDGGSTDSTCKIIEDYISEFRKKGIPVMYSSEADKGIYNAMNKALIKADGEWCYFLNADDRIYANTVLKKVFEKHVYNGIDAVYGGYCRRDEENSFVFQSEDISILPKKMPFIHQSIFVKTNILKKYM